MKWIDAFNRRSVIITGGRTYKQRLERALRESFPDGYTIHVFEKGRLPKNTDSITSESVVICKAGNESDLFKCAETRVDGIFINSEHVMPMFCVCVSKKVLGDFINSVSFNRSFNIIDIDYED